MATSTMSSPHEEPEELRRKIDLLEGDRRAFEETAKQAMRENKALIVKLRKENKEMTAKIKSLKNPNVSSDKASRVQGLRDKIHVLKMKKNTMNHDITKKQQRLAELEAKIAELGDDEGDNAGQQEEQRLRTLENSMDKANIKTQEAQHVNRTYQQIIRKMEQDRLTFDGTVTKLEKAVKERQAELKNLEEMYSDACLARDHVKKQLSIKENQLAKARQKREEEKQAVAAIAEERRKQYDAMEKRLKNASATLRAKSARQDPRSSVADELEEYEQAMRLIRDATGVIAIEDVVQRFLSQGETQSHLQQLQKEYKETLRKLQQDLDKAKKQQEAVRYSGEAQAAGNSRLLSEFQQHLQITEQECENARLDLEKREKLIVELATGVDALLDKLKYSLTDEDEDPESTKERIEKAQDLFAKLKRQIENKKTELEVDEVEPRDSMSHVLPADNTRIDLSLPELSNFDKDQDSGSDDEDDDDEFISREQMKKQAKALVDARNAKNRRQLRD